MKKLNPISSHCPQHGIRAVESSLWWYGYIIMNQQSEQYKTCTKCDESKLMNEFVKDKRNKDGLGSWCKSCTREQQKKYREKNKEKEREREKRWREENKEYYKKRKKKYREENIEKCRELGRKWEKENKDYRKKYREKYRKENEVYCKELIKKWKKENPEYYKKLSKKWREENKKYRNEHERNKRKADLLYKLSGDIRNRINNSFKKQGYTKSSNTYEIIGLEYSELYKWLNGKASNGLNIDVDKIHLDHVIPTSLANTEEEVLILNHFSNFQLLTSEENLSKHNNYIYEKNLNRVLQYHPNPEVLKEIINKSGIKTIKIKRHEKQDIETNDSKVS